MQQTVLSATAFTTSFLLPQNGAKANDEEQPIVILHTNDMHSHIDPFPMDGSANQGCGGVAARAVIINEIRGKNKHVLLLMLVIFLVTHLTLNYLKVSLK